MGRLRVQNKMERRNSEDFRSGDMYMRLISYILIRLQQSATT